MVQPFGPQGDVGTAPMQAPPTGAGAGAETPGRYTVPAPPCMLAVSVHRGGEDHEGLTRYAHLDLGDDPINEDSDETEYIALGAALANSSDEGGFHGEDPSADEEAFHGDAECPPMKMLKVDTKNAEWRRQ